MDGEVRADEANETARVEAFSDGIFAIAITLLILEIHLPHDVPLRHALVALWPSYLAYFASFVTIGVMWMNHHRLFNLIARSDQALLGLNLLLMLGISVVPFPTSVVAAAIATREARTAAIVYSGWFVFIAVAFNVLWRYASKGDRLLASNVDRASVQGITRQYSFGPLYYLIAIGIAFISPVASVAFNLALAVFFAIPARAFWRDQSSQPFRAQ